MDDTSLSLLERLRKPEREPRAWERFDRLYSPLLHYWARKSGLTAEQARDAVQDVLVSLLDKLKQFQHDGRSFRGWLRTVVQNECRDFFRRRHREYVATNDDALSEMAIIDDSQTFDDEEYRAWVARRALQLMQSEFEDNTWRACWGMTVDNRSAREVAAELGITENAAFLARSRVLRRLREEFDGLLD